MTVPTDIANLGAVGLGTLGPADIGYTTGG